MASLLDSVVGPMLLYYWNLCIIVCSVSSCTVGGLFYVFCDVTGARACSKRALCVGGILLAAALFGCSQAASGGERRLLSTGSGLGTRLRGLEMKMWCLREAILLMQFAHLLGKT